MCKFEYYYFEYFWRIWDPYRFRLLYKWLLLIAPGLCHGMVRNFYASIPWKGCQQDRTDHWLSGDPDTLETEQSPTTQKLQRHNSIKSLVNWLPDIKSADMGMIHTHYTWIIPSPSKLPSQMSFLSAWSLIFSIIPSLPLSPTTEWNKCAASSVFRLQK